MSQDTKLLQVAQEPVVPVQYAHQMMQECLDDCLGNEEAANQQYSKMMKALARYQASDKEKRLNRRASKSVSSLKSTRKNKRARHEPSQSISNSSASNSGSNSESESAVSTSESEDEQPKLKWCKPGVLSRRLGISISILRNWAKAKVVRSMVSSGGHRLFHVKSVLQYIKASSLDKDSAGAQIPVKPSSARHVVYVRMKRGKRTQDELKTMGEQLTRELVQHYEIPEDNFFILVDRDSKQADQPGREDMFADNDMTRELLKKICDRSCSTVVLQRAEDISSIPSSYALFCLLCRNSGVTIEVLPELCLYTK
jgi:hypothetical protein